MMFLIIKVSLVLLSLEDKVHTITKFMVLKSIKTNLINIRECKKCKIGESWYSHFRKRFKESLLIKFKMKIVPIHKDSYPEFFPVKMIIGIILLLKRKTRKIKVWI